MAKPKNKPINYTLPKNKKQAQVSESVAAYEAKNRWDEILDQVYTQGKRFAIKRRGKIMAIVSPQVDFEPKENLRSQRDLASLLNEIHRQVPDIPEEEVQRDIQEAIKAVRSQQ